MYLKSNKLRNELWWLIISVDYHYNRIAIADYEMDKDYLTLWLEDKQDFKNTLDECLQLQIPLRAFAKIIKDEQLNSYETLLLHPEKQFLYTGRTEISKPIKWYNCDATTVERRWAREAALKSILTHLVENVNFSVHDYAL